MTKNRKRNIRRFLGATYTHCYICGGKLDEKWNVDHVLARALGGRSTMDNLRPTHPQCNEWKGRLERRIVEFNRLSSPDKHSANARSGNSSDRLNRKDGNGGKEPMCLRNNAGVRITS